MDSQLDSHSTDLLPVPVLSRSAGLASLQYALNPRAIAVIGASEHPNKIGGRPLTYLARFGYRGRVYPINPNRASVQGLVAYPTLAALPEVPDLAVIATPTAATVGAVAACASSGVKVSIVMSSGFGETADPSAIRSEQDIVSLARASGMRVIGPNSQGLANFANGAVASFSTIFLDSEARDGPVAIVSQSGVMSAVPYGLLRARGIGVRYAHSTGNDADVSMSELALAVLSDPDVRLLLLYFEALRDPETLASAAAAARERDIPIVAIKSGRSVRGQAAARSHTGALATEDRVVDAFFRHHAIWRVRDVHEMIAATELYLKGWRPRGRRLVAVSNSGASCVMAADTAKDVDLELATLKTETVASLAAALPVFATVTNPIDVTAALLTDNSLFGRVLSTVAEDPATDLLFVGLSAAGAGYDVDAFATAASRFAEMRSIPITVAAPQDGVAAHFRAAGIPTFANQTEAIRSLSQIVHHTALMRRKHHPPPICEVVPLPAGESRFLSEADGLAFLRRWGLPTVTHQLCTTEADVRAAFAEIGVPLVLKACSPRVPHKSELGLVVLNIQTAGDALSAFRAMRTRMDELGLSQEPVLAAQMLRGRRELALGARLDPTFGPVIMVGDGGKYVEALCDLDFLLPPFDADAVRESLNRLRIAPILNGVRGEPPLNVEPLCQAAARLGQLMTALDTIASIDINPFILGAEGDPFAIVDALVERRDVTSVKATAVEARG
jgi:acyl-CoA synthetase (NDP forming)